MISANAIANNFQEWQQTILQDGTTIHAKKFSGKEHDELCDRFHSTFNSFAVGEKTVIVSCFETYTNIAVFQS